MGIDRPGFKISWALSGKDDIGGANVLLSVRPARKAPAPVHCGGTVCGISGVFAEERAFERKALRCWDKRREFLLHAVTKMVLF